MKLLKRTSIITLAIIVSMAMAAPAFASSITKSGAVSKALKNAGVTKAGVHKLKVSKENRKYEIEFIRNKDNAEFEYEICIKNGRILEKEIDYKLPRAKGTKKIGKKKARAKAAAYTKVRLSTVKKGRCTYDKKDREYDLKFRTTKYKYELDIDAASGKVKEYSKKYRR